MSLTYKMYKGGYEDGVLWNKTEVFYFFFLFASILNIPSVYTGDKVWWTEAGTEATLSSPTFEALIMVYYQFFVTFSTFFLYTWLSLWLKWELRKIMYRNQVTYIALCGIVDNDKPIKMILLVFFLKECRLLKRRQEGK